MDSDSDKRAAQRLDRLEAVQAAVLDIGRRSVRCQDLHGFFEAVHEAIGSLMYARNMYIAMRDGGRETIRYVYDVDEVDAVQAPDTAHPLLGADQSPTAWVIRNGQPLNVTGEEFAEQVASGRVWGTGASAEHWLGMPLIDSDGRTFGAIVLQSYTPGVRYGEEDVALFELMSHHVAHAIEQVMFANRLERAIIERTRSLEREIAERRRAEGLQHALYEISALSTREIELDAFYAELHRILGGLMYARNFVIALYDEENHDLVRFPYEVDEKDEAMPDTYRWPATWGATGFVLTSGQPQRIDRERFQRLMEDGSMQHVTGSIEINVWMGAPMVYQGSILGAIIVQSYDPEIGYDDDDLAVLTFVAEHIAAALSRRQADIALRAAHAGLAASASALQAKNHELEKTLEDLSVAQSDLMRQEKLASLGALVAGIAHEVNTPLGICVTAVSHLDEETRHVLRNFEEGKLDEGEVRDYCGMARETLRILDNNTRRASELIRSFKQVAVDQSSDEAREIVLADYIGETLKALRPRFKNTRHGVDLDCDPQLRTRTLPGAISQIFTNLVINSLMHGFEHIEEGHIRIGVRRDGSTIQIDYQDDGGGMTAETLRRLFDPFYTTKRGRGGSGLGANIVYNLVTAKLGGTIAVDSAPCTGLHYRIRLPEMAAG